MTAYDQLRHITERTDQVIATLEADAVRRQTAEQGELLPVLPTDVESRKEIPMCTGFVDYFPLAMAAVANCSFIANEQHNPGEPMHWSRNKSTEHADKIIKHLTDRGTIDTDGIRHSAKLAWRAMALLQTELEAAGGIPGRASR